jgi:hypothetical protein
VEVGASLLADGQAAEAVEPRLRARSRACRRIDEPAVATALLAAFDPLAGDARNEPMRPAFRATRLGVVDPTGVRLVGAVGRTEPCPVAVWHRGSAPSAGCRAIGRPSASGRWFDKLTRRCVPLASVTRRRFGPGLPRSVRSGRRQAPFGRDGVTVQARPTPVDRTGRVSALPRTGCRGAHISAPARRAGRRQHVMPLPQPDCRSDAGRCRRRAASRGRAGLGPITPPDA